MAHEWSYSWGSIVIGVRTWSRRLRSTAELRVNDTIVDVADWGLWAHLAAPILVNGTRHLVEAKVGVPPESVKLACNIAIDGQVVGGDTERAPAMPDFTSRRTLPLIRRVSNIAIVRNMFRLGPFRGNASCYGMLL